MPTITKICAVKRAPNRHSVYLEGKFAFACNQNVIARFRLRQGMEISDAKIREIEQGEVRQKCLDRALLLVQTRLHSRVELQRKLQRARFSPELVEQVIADLAKLGYVDDQRFAQARVSLALERKHHGRRRAMTDLLQRGVSEPVARRALGENYPAADELITARKLAEKHVARLRRLEPAVARRRLAGLLSRRGFGFEQISSVVESVLGTQQDAGA